MNKSQLKEIIKSAFTEIKVIRTMSNEEAYNTCLDVLGPMTTFTLTANYDTLDEYGKNDLAKATIIIDIENYMYHANFRIDKEINVCALIASILKTIQ